MKKKAQPSTNGRQKARQRIAAHRNTPLFSHKKWSIVKFDDLNIKLIHEDDAPNTVRYYATLGGALMGLRKEIGFASPDLNAAIDAWDELGAKIAAAAL